MVIKRTRIPTCQEWNRLVAATNGDNGVMHWREMFSWCADDIEASRTCVIRGYCGPGHWHRGNPALRAACTGFRPTFETHNPDSIADGATVLVGTLYMDGRPIWTNHSYASDVPDYIPGAKLEIGPHSTTPRIGFGPSKLAGSLLRTGICCGTSLAKTSASRTSAEGGAPMIFYIADWHYNHNNILAYDNRPFKTVEEMNTALVERWNSVVTPTDTVYVLGDMFWGGETKAVPVLDSLNGEKVLIVGNHDQCKNAEFKKRFAQIASYMEIADGDRHVVLCHYPMPCFNKWALSSRLLVSEMKAPAI